MMMNRETLLDFVQNDLNGVETTQSLVDFDLETIENAVNRFETEVRDSQVRLRCSK